MEKTFTSRSHGHFSVYLSMFMPKAFFKGNYLLVRCSKFVYLFCVSCVALMWDILGKVSIRKDDLCKYSGKEDWFGLQPVDPNSEVQVIYRNTNHFQTWDI